MRYWLAICENTETQTDQQEGSRWGDRQSVAQLVPLAKANNEAHPAGSRGATMTTGLKDGTPHALSRHPRPSRRAPS
jgi:hypothetical protein